MNNFLFSAFILVMLGTSLIEFLRMKKYNVFDTTGCFVLITNMLLLGVMALSNDYDFISLKLLLIVETVFMVPTIVVICRLLTEFLVLMLAIFGLNSKEQIQPQEAEQTDSAK